MPIPREQFDKGLGHQENAIMQLLESAPDNAFSLEEIADAVGVPTMATFARFALALTLTDLEKKGLVLSRVLGGSTYYAVAKSSSKR